METELVDKLFEPFRSRASCALPDETDNDQINMSLRQLGRFVEKPSRKPPTLDVMAHCLRNVGGKLRTASGNDFAAFLEQHLKDPESFCDSFPRSLHRYVDLFRNKAAHVERMSLEESRDARAFRLEEPVRLLTELAEGLIAQQPAAGP
ncbi:MAG: hypothetical protein ACXVII_41265 [Solirubrobacteraceae bacterium]